MASPVLAQAAPDRPMSDEDKRGQFVANRLAPQISQDLEGAVALRMYLDAQVDARYGPRIGGYTILNDQGSVNAALVDDGPPANN